MPPRRGGPTSWKPALKTHSLIAALASILLMAGCAHTPVQMSMDAELQRRCAEDGGTRVYERAERPNQRFRLGLQKYHPNEPYYLEIEEQVLKKSNGTPVTGGYFLKRLHEKVFRAADGALMAESVSYIRFGGDLANPFHPTGEYCPHVVGAHQSLDEQVLGPVH